MPRSALTSRERDKGTKAGTADAAPRVRCGSSRWRQVLLVAVVVMLVFVVVTARLFVWPTQGMPPRVSAIVLLAGPGDRLGPALDLARQHRAPVLVVSQGQHGYGGPCPAATPGVSLICFEPDPGNTRGEAEFVGRLAVKYHWASLVLVSSRAQDTRARLVMKRCFGGLVYVVTGTLPLRAWPYQIAYEWGALFKSLILYRGC
jgi:uncharacterized SAM-binding protein YcdF (DUF218 family)